MPRARQGPLTLSGNASIFTARQLHDPIPTLSNNLVLSGPTDLTVAVNLDAPAASSVNFTGSISGNGTARFGNGASYRYSGAGAASGDMLLQVHNGTLLIDGVMPSPNGSVGNTGTGVATIGRNGTIGGEFAGRHDLFPRRSGTGRRRPTHRRRRKLLRKPDAVRPERGGRARRRLRSARDDHQPSP